jgi:hypothetical protein
MEDVVRIPLQNKVRSGVSTGGAIIRFTYAEVPKTEHPIFALIRYTVDDQQQERGLRLDLDKQVFLDHFEEGSQEERLLDYVTPDIIASVYARLHGEESLDREGGIHRGGSRFEFENDSPLVELPPGREGPDSMLP